MQSELGAQFYFRKGRSEVDFLLRNGERLVPVEIKVRFTEGDLADLCSLLGRAGFDRGLALTLNDFGMRRGRGSRVVIYPVWAFLLFSDRILQGLKA